MKLEPLQLDTYDKICIYEFGMGPEFFSTTTLCQCLIFGLPGWVWKAFWIL
jgi:hypothetical protein